VVVVASVESVDLGGEPADDTVGDGAAVIVSHRYRLVYDDGGEPEVVVAATPAEAVRLRTHLGLPIGIVALDLLAAILDQPRGDRFPLLRRMWGDRIFDES
jgi:hypothetical protein